ncbi:MAG: omptin family outer membrane protease [Spirochaetaceae bacterium]|jgi:outer membrane protease|nr:omptin family outer membrane protease [Spirochaetaceae bacterium]
MSDNDITWKQSNNSEQNKQTATCPQGALAPSRSKIFPHPPLLPLLLFILALAAQNVPAQEQAAQELTAGGKNFQFSLGASLGLLHGQGVEVVYKALGSDNLLSELLWDIKPIGYAGLNAALAWQKPEAKWGFFAAAAIKFGFLGKTGIMQDSDWLEYDYPDWLIYYSAHDNITMRAMLLDANFGMSYRLSQSMVLKMSLEYHFMHFAWTALGGSFVYPQSNGGHMYFEEPIESCRYRQMWHIIAPMFAFYGKFNPYFDITLSFAITPLIIADNIDNHLLRDMDIVFLMFGGLFVEPKLEFAWTPKDFLSLSFSTSYRYVKAARGIGYKEAGSSVGASYHAFDVALTAQYRVNWAR